MVTGKSKDHGKKPAKGAKTAAAKPSSKSVPKPAPKPAPKSAPKPAPKAAPKPVAKPKADPQPTLPLGKPTVAPTPAPTASPAPVLPPEVPPPPPVDPQVQAIMAKAVEAHRQNRVDEAIALYTQVIRAAPHFVDAHNNLGVALRSQKRSEAAIACYRRAVALDPRHAASYSNLGNAYRDLARYADAVAAHRQALALSPDGRDTLYNLALSLRDLGEMDESLVLLERILAEHPDHHECRWDRAISYLQLGDYGRGLPEYESRWNLKRSPPRQVPRPRWDGSPLGERTLFLHQEQGFGDMLQFARFIAPAKRAFGGRMILECPPPLLRLFGSVEGIDGVVPSGQMPADADVYLPMLELPARLGVTLADLPGPVPYLAAPANHPFRLPPTAPGLLKVGLIWAGKLTPRDRSCPFGKILELTGNPRCAFFSLQLGDRMADLAQQGCPALIADLAPMLRDFADTAAVMNQLDLIISIDSAAAHLAGALGRPTWALLLHASDWRWLMNRSDSPWYPSMRLFRQKRSNDWDAVFAEVNDALADLARGRTPADSAR